MWKFYLSLIKQKKRQHLVIIIEQTRNKDLPIGLIIIKDCLLKDTKISALGVIDLPRENPQEKQSSQIYFEVTFLIYVTLIFQPIAFAKRLVTTLKAF